MPSAEWTSSPSRNIYILNFCLLHSLQVTEQHFANASSCYHLNPLCKQMRATNSQQGFAWMTSALSAPLSNSPWAAASAQAGQCSPSSSLGELWEYSRKQNSTKADSPTGSRPTNSSEARTSCCFLEGPWCIFPKSFFYHQLLLHFLLGVLTSLLLL